MKGRDLLGGDVRGVRLQPDLLYSETEYPRVAGWSPLQALTDGRWKTIRSGTLTEVYDLEHDPGERHDVLSAQGNVAAAMNARIDQLHAVTPASTREISAEASERLRALGYVASSPAQRTSGSSLHPAARIASWNQFENALSALAAHRADALPVLKSLAAANPDAMVFQTTFARAMQESGDVTGALDAYRRAAKKWP